MAEAKELVMRFMVLVLGAYLLAGAIPSAIATLRNVSTVGWDPGAAAMMSLSQIIVAIGGIVLILGGIFY